MFILPAGISLNLFLEDILCSRMAIYTLLLISILSYSGECFLGAQSRRNGSPLMASIRGIKDANELADLLGRQGKNPFVVDFQKSSCGPCIKMAPELEKMAEKYDGFVEFFKVDADSSKDALQLMRDTGVRAVPTFYIYEQGTKVDMVNGARLDEVETSIRSCLRGKKLPMP